MAMDSGQLILSPGLACGMCIRWIGDHWSALLKILDKVLREEDVQGPIESDPQLLFEARELQKVDRTPEPPGNKPRKIEAENSGYTCATTDRRQQTECLEPERNQILPSNTRENVVSEHFAFA